MGGSSIDWQKSTFSGGGGANSLEIAEHEGRIVLRESGMPDTVVTTTPAKLAAFLKGVKAGEFDDFVE
ncbi:DUF397 domain-containing protein [Streptomyces sp. NPDC050560]|uniref:DUF397 domain-containing protein n=1 Tax=Streptomyces sp. NPDC050560 TaxID=3365630 RepID=UPI003791B62D